MTSLILAFMIFVLLSATPIAIEDDAKVPKSIVVENKNTWHFAFSPDGREIAYRFVDEPDRIIVYDILNQTYKSSSAPQGYFVFLSIDKLLISNFTGTETILKVFDLTTEEQRTIVTDERLPRFLDVIKYSQNFVVGFLNNSSQKMDYVVINSTTGSKTDLILPEARGRAISESILYYSNESDNFSLWGIDLFSGNKLKVGDFKVSSLSTTYQINQTTLAFIQPTDPSAIWIHPGNRRIAISGLLSEAKISPDGAHISILVTFQPKPGEFPPPTQLVLLDISESGTGLGSGSVQPTPAKQTPGFEMILCAIIVTVMAIRYRRQT